VHTLDTQGSLTGSELPVHVTGLHLTDSGSSVHVSYWWVTILLHLSACHLQLSVVSSITSVSLYTHS